MFFVQILGERRIRVHTLALPVTSKLSDIYAYADEEAIISSLSKLGKFFVFKISLLGLNPQLIRIF